MSDSNSRKRKKSPGSPSDSAAHQPGQIGLADETSAVSESSADLWELDHWHRERLPRLEDTLFSCASCGLVGSTNPPQPDGSILAIARLIPPQLRLLWCLHSVCRPCLVSSCARGDGTAVCPSCMEVTVLPAVGWVDTLHPNYWCLRRYQTRYQTQSEHAQGKPSLECGECAEGMPVESMVGACLDCHELLCDVHWIAHKKGRKTAAHILTKDLERFSETSRDSLMHMGTVWSGVLCSTHTQHAVVGFCLACKELVCKLCQERNHRQHAIDYEFDLAQSEKTRLASLLMEGDEAAEVCERNVADLKAMIEDVNAEATKASEEVTTAAQKVIKYLRNEEKCTLDSIDESRWFLLKKLEKRLEEKKTAKSRLDRAQYLSQVAIDGGINDAQVLHVHRTLQSNLRRGISDCRKTIDLSGFPSAKSVRKPCMAFMEKVELLRGLPEQQINEAISAGPTEEQCPWSLRTCVNLPAVHQHSLHHVFLLSTCPEDEHVRNLPVAVVRSPSGDVEKCRFSPCICKGEAVDCAAARICDGRRVDVHFVPKEPGGHELFVTWNGRHVRNSPCLFNVEHHPFTTLFQHLPNPTHPGAFWNYGLARPSRFPLKWGVYCPQLPPCIAMFSVSVQLLESTNPPTTTELSSCHWLADDDIHITPRGISLGPPGARFNMKDLRDGDAMQLELLLTDQEWIIKLLHLRSGRSSSVRGEFAGSVAWVAASVTYPECSPMHLLPAFF